MTENDSLKAQAGALKLHGLVSHWDEVTPEQTPWLAQWVSWEINERKQRSLERRLSSAKLGRFKSLTEFNWQWPSKIDEQAIHRIMQLDFINDASNIILIGSNGVGKSTIAQNVGHQAVMQGHTVLFSRTRRR
jgi:DNA replication protein DnaC